MSVQSQAAPLVECFHDRRTVVNKIKRSQTSGERMIPGCHGGRSERVRCDPRTGSPEWIVQPQDTAVEEGQPGFSAPVTHGGTPNTGTLTKRSPISEERIGSRHASSDSHRVKVNTRLSVCRAPFILSLTRTAEDHSAECKDAQTYS
ncbi:hypothetical protein cypCar_00040328 [Cyprinus carpio]|nr:hypothetical protein cypCar_00040328 [Cyprinus carpio]